MTSTYLGTTTHSVCKYSESLTRYDGSTKPASERVIKLPLYKKE